MIKDEKVNGVVVGHRHIDIELFLSRTISVVKVGPYPTEANNW